jgi:3-hydroxyacyl-CoA dehydrogenase
LADIDLALRLGAAHPVGPFERMDRLGSRLGVIARLQRLAHRHERFAPAPALLVDA